MVLTQDSSGTFVLRTTYQEFQTHGDQIKAAHFRWDRVNKVWYTTNADHASLLISCADARCRQTLGAIASKREETIAASSATDADISIPAPEGYVFRPFQRAGIKFALDHPNCLIADEMGLGKTVQGIGLINLDPTLRRILIVCPVNAKRVWETHLDRWLVTPRSVGLAKGSKFPPTEVVIINKDILFKHETALRAIHWDLMIVDEVHYFRNTTARMTRMLFGHVPTSAQIAKAREKGEEEPREVAPIPARRRVYLTGTPLVNRPRELYPLLHSLDPSRWRSFWAFAQKYCDAHQERIYVPGGRGATKLVWKTDGCSNTDELQRILRSTVMIRRLKSQVLTELPPKVHQTIPVEPDAEQAAVLAEEEKLFAKHRDKIEEALENLRWAEENDDDEAAREADETIRTGFRVAFEEMSRVRRETAIAKIPNIITHAKDLLDEQELPKIAIWLHHREVVEAVVDGLQEYGVVSVIGGDSDLHRKKVEEQFQTDPKVRVFVGSIQAAGVALTLTASNVAVFGELDWVPGNMRQAEDRHHRIGQRDTVMIQHLVFEGSMDDLLSTVLIHKQAVSDAVLDNPLQDFTMPTDDPSRTARKQHEYSAVERDAALQCVRILSSYDPDGARVKNDIGWNRVDGRFGKSLASQPSLTDKQCQIAKRMLKKYHRQLPLELFRILYPDFGKETGNEA